jgi:adenylate cyclase
MSCAAKPRRGRITISSPEQPRARLRLRVRITVQLIDAVTGTHLWADRFDGSLEDVFELQDQIAISAAGVIEPTLQVAETRRVFL